MPRFKLVIEYAGTRYSGWQVQKNARTVQGELERALSDVLDAPCEAQGSGRTDAGVHALMQVAHFDARIAGPLDRFRGAVNDLLPADINVLSMAPVPARFHARHAARARSYLYQVARRRSAFTKPYVWWVKEPLNATRMQDSARSFVGMHDFRSFSDEDPDRKSTAVLVNDVTVGEDGDLLLVRITASHFLWKMVRRMVGVLVEIGRGGLSPADLTRYLHHASPTPARLTAPASGLFLEQVFYEPDQTARPLRAAVPMPALHFVSERHVQTPAK